MRASPLRLSVVLTALLASQAAFTEGLVAQVAGDGGPIPLGTTRGERYERLVIRNATIVSGRGTPSTNRGMPPEGPVDIVIEGNRIVNLIPVDPVNAASGRGRVSGDRIIDATGMVVLPGLVEMHAHLRGNGGAMGDRSLDFAYRLYLGHGVTTIRDAGTGAGLDVLTAQRRSSDTNGIVAPRLVLCQRWPLPLRAWDVGHTPENARAMVQQFRQLGADCIKVSKSPGQYPDVLAAIVDEGRKLGMPTMVDLKVSETDARVASEAGVASIEHWYGIPDAALNGSQSFPGDYNYWDELDRFRWAGHLWAEADRQPDRLRAVLETMVAHGTGWNPTMVVYEKNRDLARAVTMPWRETLAHPYVLDEYPDSSVHGAYHHEWKTSDEIAWRQNFSIWMRYVREFHRMGGLLTVGSDEGEVGGLALIRELELLQEAGIHPIDIIKLATTNAAQVLGFKDHCGVRVGCIADLAVVNGNPIDNFKVMYGRGYGFTGTMRPEERAKHGGVEWTIKDGIVFDAQALLREAEWYVQQEKARLGWGRVVSSR